MRSFEFIIETEDYHGQHTAPNKQSGAPLYDLTMNDIYPDDIYSSNGPRYYSSGNDDSTIFALINRFHNKPHSKVTIYRAVPYQKSNQELLAKLTDQMAQYHRRGRIPQEYHGQFQNGSDWFNWAYDEKERLESLPNNTSEKLSINPGDWVTIDKRYAIEHGKFNLKNNYKIISKSVPVTQVFTSGDSVQEWGWDPS